MESVHNGMTSLKLYLTCFSACLTIAISFVLLLLHNGFVLSVLNIIHVLNLESVCFDSKHLYITLNMVYILFIAIVDLWNVNKISVSVSCQAYLCFIAPFFPVT